MALVKFRELLTESGETLLEAEWFTDLEAEESGVTEEFEEADSWIRKIDLTDEQVKERNESARTFFDFVYGDAVDTGFEI